MEHFRLRTSKDYHRVEVAQIRENHIDPIKRLIEER